MIEGLPELTEEQLHAHFSTYGEVVDVSVVPNKGLSFVTFHSTEVVEALAAQIHDGMLVVYCLSWLFASGLLRATEKSPPLLWVTARTVIYFHTNTSTTVIDEIYAIKMHHASKKGTTEYLFAYWVRFRIIISFFFLIITCHEEVLARYEIQQENGMARVVLSV